MCDNLMNQIKKVVPGVTFVTMQSTSTSSVGGVHHTVMWKEIFCACEHSVQVTGNILCM